MIEILHKAKRIDNREWVEGYYTKIIGKLSKKERHYIYTGKLPFLVEIDPETVCIYTGKNDGKGNKIWQHDVISINTYDYMEPAEDFLGEVVYCEAWACWCIKEPGAEKPIPLCECEGSYKTDIYVHGNSMDNPELLEVE